MSPGGLLILCGESAFGGSLMVRFRAYSSVFWGVVGAMVLCELYCFFSFCSFLERKIGILLDLFFVMEEVRLVFKCAVVGFGHGRGGNEMRCFASLGSCLRLEWFFCFMPGLFSRYDTGDMFGGTGR